MNKIIVLVSVLMFVAAVAFPQIKADPTSWKTNDFTTDWTEYEWTFPTNTLINGENSVMFTYTSGAHKLCLKDVVIMADGITILTDETEKSAGSNPKSAVYSFNLATVPEELTFTAKARTSGGSDSNGYICFGDHIVDGVLYIGYGQIKVPDKQYKGNQDITEIRFTETLEKIGANAFEGVDGLKKIVIPGNVKIIGSGAFSACSNLEEVVIEEGVEEICVYAFYACPNLQLVTMPKNVQKIVPDGLYWSNNTTRIFRCYAGSEAYNLALKNGYKTEIIDIDEQNADNITKLIYSTNEVIYPVDIECKNLQEIQMAKANTISAGAFQKCPVERIDLTNAVVSIGENAFNDKTKLRTPRGSYAETWALQHGYFLCEACADLSTYTKDESLQINEDFERVLCNSDMPFDIDYYHFNVANPLTLDIVDGRLELTSYMLYPCENVTIIQTDANGTETAIATYDKIQPLARYVVLNETDPNATYTVSADDEFYKSLNKIPMKWEISYTRTRKNGTPGDWLILRAPQCREWISLVTQLAYIFGSEEFKDYFLSAENRFFTGDASLGYQSTVQNYLSLEQIAALYEKLLTHKLQLGALDDRRNGNVAGMGSVSGNLIGLDEPQLGRHYSSTTYFATFAHEIMHNMGYNHDSNFCGNGSNGIKFQGDFEGLVKQFKALDCLPYNDESILATKLYWYDDYYYQNQAIEDDESYENQIIDSVLIVYDGVKEIKKQEYYGKKEIQQISFPSSVTKINGLAFHSCANLESVTIPDGVKNVGNAAFQNCTSLISVEIGSGLSELNYRVFKGSGLTEVTIPANIKIIGKEAFQDCKDLKTVVIEDGVQEIGDNAFRSCNIDTIRIPASVTELGSNITSKTVVWVVERGSAAYYNALENNYPIVLESESEEEVAAQIIAESASAELASAIGWQTGDFAKTYDRYRWDFSDELKGAGKYRVTFKYTGGTCMLCLSDALFVADGKAIAHFFERRTAGYNPSQIVYEITVPTGTESLELLALAKTDGGIESKGTVKVEYLGGGDNQGGEGQTSVIEQITNINIYTYGKTIIVENATEEILVYDVMGRVICRDATPCVRAELRMYGVGVYIVKVGDFAKKVVIE